MNNEEQKKAQEKIKNIRETCLHQGSYKLAGHSQGLDNRQPKAILITTLFCETCGSVFTMVQVVDLPASQIAVAQIKRN